MALWSRKHTLWHLVRFFSLADVEAWAGQLLRPPDWLTPESRERFRETQVGAVRSDDRFFHSRARELVYRIITGGAKMFPGESEDRPWEFRYPDVEPRHRRVYAGYST